MPTYEYRCERCSHTFEIKMTVDEKKKTKVSCPQCNSEEVGQQLFGVSFSGKKKTDRNSSGGCCGDGTGCCG